MNINKYFPLLFHVILAAGMIGWAAGLHHTPGSSIVTTYTVTGFAAGLGVTAFLRVLFELH